MKLVKTLALIAGAMVINTEAVNLSSERICHSRVCKYVERTMHLFFGREGLEPYDKDKDGKFSREEL